MKLIIKSVLSLVGIVLMASGQATAQTANTAGELNVSEGLTKFIPSASGYDEDNPGALTPKNQKEVERIPSTTETPAKAE